MHCTHMNTVCPHNYTMYTHVHLYIHNYQQDCVILESHEVSRALHTRAHALCHACTLSARLMFVQSFILVSTEVLSSFSMVLKQYFFPSQPRVFALICTCIRMHVAYSHVLVYTLGSYVCIHSLHDAGCVYNYTEATLAKHKVYMYKIVGT